MTRVMMRAKIRARASMDVNMLLSEPQQRFRLVLAAATCARATHRGQDPPASTRLCTCICLHAHVCSVGVCVSVPFESTQVWL